MMPAAAIRFFDGKHPRFTQVPPSVRFSVIAAVLPSSAALMAVANAVDPEPKMTKSTLCVCIYNLQRASSMHARWFLGLRLCALHILTIGQAQQLTVVSSDPYGLSVVRVEELTKLFERGVRSERCRRGRHNFFDCPIGLGFDLLRTDLTQ